MGKAEDTFKEHNGEKPHADVKNQCQCDDCKAYRAPKAKNADGK